LSSFDIGLGWVVKKIFHFLFLSHQTRIISTKKQQRMMISAKDKSAWMVIGLFLFSLTIPFLQQTTEDGASYSATNFHVSVHPL
jgi:hypothetical protein